MKLLTFEHNGSRHIGALLADSGMISDFTASEPSAPHFRDMLSLIDAGADASAEARDLVERPKVRLSYSSVRLLAPVPEPRQMRDFLCFEKHLRQARANRYLFGIGDKAMDPANVEVPAIWYEQPIYYKCNRFSVIGSDQDVDGHDIARFSTMSWSLASFLVSGARTFPATTPTSISLVIASSMTSVLAMPKCARCRVNSDRPRAKTLIQETFLGLGWSPRMKFQTPTVSA